jgi:hypothetical protein
MITGDTSVHNDLGYSYNVPENEEISYSWSVENGSIVAHPSEYSTDIQWGNPGTGIIKAWGIDARGCRSDTATLAVSISSTGILRYQQQDYHVYPVPARDWISAGNLGSTAAYEIFDITGQLVASGKLEPGGTIIIKDLPAGTYLIQLVVESLRCNPRIFMKH